MDDTYAIDKGIQSPYNVHTFIAAEDLAANRAVVLDGTSGEVGYATATTDTVIGTTQEAVLAGAEVQVFCIAPVQKLLAHSALYPGEYVGLTSNVLGAGSYGGYVEKLVPGGSTTLIGCLGMALDRATTLGDVVRVLCIGSAGAIIE